MPKIQTKNGETARETKASAQDLSPSSLLDLEEISRLIELMIEKGISEFEIERPGLRLKIGRNTVVGSAETLTQFAQHTSSTGKPGHLSSSLPSDIHGQRKAAAVEPPAEKISAKDLHVVRSPMVGTFYSAPSEGAQPFVRIGEHVRQGQVLCIIEAMKLMNEIEADVAGEVLKCHVGNGQPVEYGEPLFDLRPASVKP